VLLMLAALAFGASTMRAAAAGPAGPAGSISGKVTVTESDGKAASADVIVYVTGFTEPHDPAAPNPQIAQKERRFVPDLVAITAGEEIVFPNQDPFLHNVFSKSSARPFDLGSYRKDSPKSKDFPNAGVVDVYCNIHPEMAATILVLPNRHHVHAAGDGTYTLDGVPPGTWMVFAYTRRAVKPTSARVTVVAGQTATVDLALVRGAEPDHLNKYGEHYHEPTTTYR
jgi:plastocyanin